MSKPVIRRTYGKRDHAPAESGGDESQRSLTECVPDLAAPGALKRARSSGSTSSHAVAAASLLRASGQSMAAAQEWEYHFVSASVALFSVARAAIRRPSPQDGMRDSRADVRHASLHALLRALRPEDERSPQLVRLVSSACELLTTASAPAPAAAGDTFKLFWSTSASASAGAAGTAADLGPLDVTLARGLAALLCLANRTGHHVESLTPACVHLVVRLIAAESAALVRDYACPALRAACAADFASALELLASPATAGAGFGGAAASGGGSLHRRPSLPPPSHSASLSLDDPRAALEADIAGAFARALTPEQLALAGASSSGLAGLAAGWLPRRPGGGALRGLAGLGGEPAAGAAPGDAALLLLHYLTGLPQPEGDGAGALADDTDSRAPPSVAAGGASASLAQSEVTDAAQHIQSTRVAVASALGGQGVALLALRLASACWALRALLAEPALPPPARPSTASVPVPRSGSLLLTAAWAEAFPPRYQRAFAELRLLLVLLEDVTFSGDAAAQRATDTRVPTDLLFRAGLALKPVSTARGLRRDVTVVELLLTCIDWLLGHAPLFALRGASASAAAASEHPLLSLLHGFMRVAVNLTNHHAAGCAAVVAAVRVESAAAASPPVAALVDVAGLPWGIAVVLRVILLARGATSSAVLRSAVAGGEVGQAAGFDTLVLGLGLLTNCLEHDASARAALSSGSIRLAAFPQPDRSRMSALQARLDAGEQHPSGAAEDGAAPILALLCDLFCQHYVRLGLQSAAEAVAAGDVKDDAVDMDASGGGSESPDDVIVAAYAGMALACCMLRNEGNQRAILAMVGPAVGSPPDDISATTRRERLGPPKLHPAIAALKLVLRVFVALQTSAGVLTEDSLQHTMAVEGLLDHIQSSAVAGAITLSGPAVAAAIAPSRAASSARVTAQDADDWLWAPASDPLAPAAPSHLVSPLAGPAKLELADSPASEQERGVPAPVCASQARHRPVHTSVVEPQTGGPPGTRASAPISPHISSEPPAPPAAPTSGSPPARQQLAAPSAPTGIASLAERLVRRRASGPQSPNGGGIADGRKGISLVAVGRESGGACRGLSDDSDGSDDDGLLSSKGNGKSAASGVAPASATPGGMSALVRGSALVPEKGVPRLRTEVPDDSRGDASVFRRHIDAELAPVGPAPSTSGLLSTPGAAAGWPTPAVKTVYGASGSRAKPSAIAKAMSANDFIFSDD